MVRRLVLTNGGAEVHTQVSAPQSYLPTTVISEQYLMLIFMELRVLTGGEMITEKTFYLFYRCPERR